MPSVQFGDIILATIVDTNGVNSKPRPVVVVTPNEVLSAGGPLVVVAITATLPAVMGANHVLLHWHPNRHPITGLDSAPRLCVIGYRLSNQDDVIKRVGRIIGANLATIPGLSRASASALGDYEADDPS